MKNGLKIIFWIILFFVTGLAFGFDIDFQVDKKEVDLSDMINLDIIITWTWEIDWVDVFWADGFFVVWENQSNINLDINWVKNTQFKIKLALRPKLVGEYQVWPVTLVSWVEKIEWDETFKIKVTDNRNLWAVNSLQNDIDKEIDDEVIQKKIDEEVEKAKQRVMELYDEDKGKKEVEVSGWTGEVEDINDIDWVKSSFWKVSFIFIPIVLFFVVFHFVMNYFLSKKESVVVVREKPSVKALLKLKLNKLKKKSGDLSRAEFYAVLNMLFREYFEYLWEENATKKTFEELEDTDLKDKKIFELFKESYFSEFNNSEDSIDSRGEVVDEFIAMI